LVDYIIKNRSLKKQDSVYQAPFKIYKIKEVNVVTDYAYRNISKRFKDSTSYLDYNLYSYDRLRYNPKAITDAIFIKKGTPYSDLDGTRTYRYLSELKTFEYPDIEYIENLEDTTLTANILLKPRKKYNLNFDFDISQSNIQTLGFSFSTGLHMRNLFRGAETLEISAIGAIGASKDASNTKDQFFDINELGADLKLTIPRIFSPFKTEKIIPKYMSPATQIRLGATSQKNIGLDKQTINGVFNYKWYPKKGVTNLFDLFNIQFIKNVNSANYFNIYNSSFNTLNNIAKDIGYTVEDLTIPDGANQFINDVRDENTSIIEGSDLFKSVLSISERRSRLTQDNLIFATNFSYTRNNRENLYDEDFSQFRIKVESAGNLFSLLNKPLSINQNDDGDYQIFGVPYSQYGKIELDYTKHWDLSKNNDNVLAFRAFGGIAIPYGNSENIPFSKSYYGGGPNDNRAWEAYKLGPGKSQSVLDFNEANFKLAFNLEYRFQLAGNFEGALFTDTGNIWNVFDNIGTEDTEFINLSSLKDIAIGSGFGIRYDFSFFLIRGDIGFKTYEPSLNTNNRWFNNYNFGNAVYNIGINYPF
jgi:outer membrane protein assembly factor BamA